MKGSSPESSPLNMIGEKVEASSTKIKDDGPELLSSGIGRPVVDGHMASQNLRVRPFPLPYNRRTLGFTPSDGWVAHSDMEAPGPATWDTCSDDSMGESCFSPRRESLEVPHVRQVYNWDCGLACVLMVVRAFGVEDCTLNYLHQMCGTTSIWTVDLAHLLRRFSLDVAFLTVTIGANPSFALETFYKENMNEDVIRVDRLFEKAGPAGIRIQRRSLSMHELAGMVTGGGVLAIVLVDKRKLSHPWSNIICLPECCGVTPGYTGHYVVVCGYDDISGEFEIRDPASSSVMGRIEGAALEEARKTFGTDEDILLVGSPPQKSPSADPANVAPPRSPYQPAPVPSDPGSGQASVQLVKHAE